MNAGSEPLPAFFCEQKGLFTTFSCAAMFLIVQARKSPVQMSNLNKFVLWQQNVKRSTKRQKAKKKSLTQRSVNLRAARAMKRNLKEFFD